MFARIELADDLPSCASEVLEPLATSGLQPIGAGPAEFDAHIRREVARWGKVPKSAGIQLK